MVYVCNIIDGCSECVVLLNSKPNFFRTSLECGTLDLHLLNSSLPLFAMCQCGNCNMYVVLASFSAMMHLHQCTPDAAHLQIVLYSFA